MNTIKLRLNVTRDIDYLVNVVEVTGSYDSSNVVARNLSTIERAWLPCCEPKLLADKTAVLDESDPSLIHYQISLRNGADKVIVVKITDRMPSDTELLTASEIPALDKLDEISWVLTGVKPGEVRMISYTVKAKRDESYANQAHLEAYNQDGSGFTTADVEASVIVGGTSSLPKTGRYGGGWQPPAEFGLTSPDEGMGSPDQVLGSSYSSEGSDIP